MKLNDINSNSWGGLSWSTWIPLDASLALYQEHITKEAGFYRIKSCQNEGLVYIGQTGRDLRERTRSLARGTYRDYTNPPWNDPHTAAPLLWAYIQQNKLTYELSVASADLNFQDRQCYEDYLLYLHRLQYKHSTLINHGRLNPHWTRPTNKAKGIATKFRESPVNYKSITPARSTTDPLDGNWLNLEWSAFKPINNKYNDLKKCSGVYRIRLDNEIVYFGESKNLMNRIREHSQKEYFNDAYISVHEMPSALPHQLKERETDLIGAYYLNKKCSPKYQYKPV